MDIPLYDIVILPSPELEQRIIDTSRALSSQAALFTLDGVNFYPHVSLYMVQLKVPDVDRAKELLADIARHTDTLDLVATQHGQSLGYIDVEYRRTSEIDRLQQAVVDSINPLRDSMRDKDIARMHDATGLIKENYERYGYSRIGELFRPHATFTRLADDGIVDLAALPDPVSFSGRFTRLGLFETGDHGTCIREIAAYSLD